MVSHYHKIYDAAPTSWLFVFGEAYGFVIAALLINLITVTLNTLTAHVEIIDIGDCDALLNDDHTIPNHTVVSAPLSIETDPIVSISNSIQSYQSYGSISAPLRTYSSATVVTADTTTNSNVPF